MLGKFLNPDGEPNQDSIKNLFHRIDSNKDNLISTSELSSLVVGMQFEEMEFDKEETVDRIMSDFDVDYSGNLSNEEFYRGISKWIREARHIIAMPANHSTNFIDECHRLAKEKHYMLHGKRDEDNIESVDNPRWIM